MATGRLIITTLSFHINMHVHCVIVIVIVMAPISTSLIDDINDKIFNYAMSKVINIHISWCAIDNNNEVPSSDHDKKYADTAVPSFR